jgi:hypothetical protein
MGLSFSLGSRSPLNRHGSLDELEQDSIEPGSLMEALNSAAEVGSLVGGAIAGAFRVAIGDIPVPPPEQTNDKSTGDANAQGASTPTSATAPGSRLDQIRSSRAVSFRGSGRDNGKGVAVATSTSSTYEDVSKKASDTTLSSGAVPVPTDTLGTSSHPILMSMLISAVSFVILYALLSLYLKKNVFDVEFL